MFAVLGDIEFKVLAASPTAMESRAASSYAQHPVIGGKPRVQFTGHELEELRMQFTFHVAFCDPEQEAARLQAARAARQAMALVTGEAAYKGYYVITELQTTARHATPEGRLMALDAAMTLLEFTGDPQKPLQPPAIKRKGATPAGAGAAPAGAMTPAAKAAAYATAASSGMNAAANALRVAQALRDDPQQALARIPAVLGSLGRAAGSLEQLYPSLAGLGSALANGGAVMAAVSNATDFVVNAVSTLGSASGADAPNRIDAAATMVEGARYAWRAASSSLGQLTAQVAARQV